VVTDAAAAVVLQSPHYPSLEEKDMKANVGGIDKVVRIVVGVALLAWALLGGPAWAWIGVLPLATGLVNWCPAYSLLGMNTCPLKK
jgi:hypothetical protein